MVKSNKRFGFKLPGDDTPPPAFHVPSLARGLKIIDEERKRQAALKGMKVSGSSRIGAAKSHIEDVNNLHDSNELECLPGDDEDDAAIPGELELEKGASSSSDEASDVNEPELECGEDVDMEGDGFSDVEDREMDCEETDREPTEGEDDKREDDEREDDEQVNEDMNVLKEYHSRNGRPRPPSPARLRRLQQQVPGQQNSAVNDNEESDVQPSREKRYSKSAKQEHCTDPTQLGFYPPKWTDFLEECKVETCMYAAVRDPWPQRKSAMRGFILDAITMTIRKWRRTNRAVERGYYPKHKQRMCELLFEDLASWRGELKKAAANLVRAYYDISPPPGNHLSQVEMHRHVKRAAEDLIKKASFAHGGKDLEGRTKNFGHAAVRELSHIFFYGRENRIGNIRPEFAIRYSLTLVVTAIRCILDGFSLHGKAKFPFFSRDNYYSKWKKYNGLVIRLEEHDIHGPKFEQICREIARTGLAGGMSHRDLEDGSDHEDYDITLD